MSKTNLLTREKYFSGDAAVDGFLNGVIAGVFMGMYVLLIFLVNGLPPEEVMLFFDNSISSPLYAPVVLLAVSGIYGLVYGLIILPIISRWENIPRVGIAAATGIIYGILLWSIANFIILPESLPAGYVPGIYLLTSHMVYGLLIGLMTRQSYAAKEE